MARKTDHQRVFASSGSARRLSLERESDHATASSSARVLRGSDATRKGTSFDIPKHGDEIKGDASSSMSRTTGRNVYSPYNPGRNTMDRSERTTTRANRMRAIPTESFYDVSRLANGTPAKALRGAAAQSPKQHRNAQQAQNRSTHGTAYVDSTRNLPRNGRERQRIGLDSPPQERYADVGDSTPIEISSDEGEEDDEGNMAKRHIARDVPMSDVFPSLTKLAHGDQDKTPTSRQSRVFMSKTGKTPIVEIPKSGASSASTRHSPFNDFRLSPSAKKRSTRSPSEERLDRVGADQRRISRSPEQGRMPLSKNRPFQIATEDDSTAVGKHRKEPSRATLVSRMRSRENEQIHEMAARHSSPASSRFASAMGSVRSSLPRPAERGESSPERSRDKDLAEHAVELPLACLEFDRLARCENSANPRITHPAKDHITAQWTGNDQTISLVISSDDIKKIVLVPDEQQAMICLENESTAVTSICTIFAPIVDASAVYSFQQEPVLFAIASDHAGGQESWDRFTEHLCNLGRDKLDESLPLQIFCQSHLAHKRTAVHIIGRKNSVTKSPTAHDTEKRRASPHKSEEYKGDAEGLKEDETTRNVESTILGRSKAESAVRQCLVWPLHAPQPMTLYQTDVDKLGPQEFLNDTMIEFGLRFLLDGIQERNPELYSEIHVFSSFFYRRFTEDKRDRDKAFDNIKKWTRNVDIFSKKYLVVPINEALHWYLAIITNPFRAIPHQMSETQDGEGGYSSNDIAANGERVRLRESSDNTAASDEQDKFAAPSINHEADRARTSRSPLQIHDLRSATASVTSVSSNEKEDKSLGDDDQHSLATTPNARQINPRSSGNGLAKMIGKRQYSNAIDVDDYAGSDQSSRTSSYGRQLRSRGPALPVLSIDAASTRRVSAEDIRAKQGSWLEHSSVVLVFDSLGLRHSLVQKNMVEYLAREYKDKQSIEVDKSNTTLKEIHVTMPRQDNYHDCGLYVLYAFERFFSDPQRFMDDVIVSRNSKHQCWYASEVVLQRKWWRDTVASLVEEYNAIKEIRRREKEQEKALEKEKLAAADKNEEDEKPEIQGDPVSDTQHPDALRVSPDQLALGSTTPASLPSSLFPTQDLAMELPPPPLADSGDDTMDVSGI